LPITLAPEERRTLDEVARLHVQAVLGACNNNQTNAARVLGIDRKTLARRLDGWGITVVAQRPGLRPGSLLAIEGIDGAGITTQARRLAASLNERGHRAIVTQEPSAGPIGELIRTLLASHDVLPPSGAVRTFSLLFAADRVDHFHRVVAPALSSGTTVVSDRWYHSSLAYQRTGVERDWIAALNRYTQTPDVTIVLDVPPEIGRERRLAAGRKPEFFHDTATQQDIVAGYRATIAELRAAGERVESIDGRPSEDVVFAAILRTLALDRR
jgi:dTMP kinase